MKDLISRQAAIDALEDVSANYGKPGNREWHPHIEECKAEIRCLPSAQPEIIHCRDCKHRPKATRADEKVFFGFSVKFPDEKCPCYCEDGWYGWYPEDDFYCGYAERRGDGSD